MPCAHACSCRISSCAVLMHGLFGLCRYFVIANAIAAVYNLVVLLVRRLILRRRMAGLVVHMLDMVRFFSESLCAVDTHHGIFDIFFTRTKWMALIVQNCIGRKNFLYFNWLILTILPIYAHIPLKDKTIHIITIYSSFITNQLWNSPSTLTTNHLSSRETRQFSCMCIICSCLLEMVACGECERCHIHCISHNPAKPDVFRTLEPCNNCVL